jgi:hypothetical protein
MTQNTPPVPSAAPGPHSPSKADGWWPRASTRVQLYSAAIIWGVGAAILLVRGVLFLHDRWAAALIALALLVGIAKERYILNRYARKAVRRIHERGTAFFFGFFSVKSWLFIVVMMGGGIMLRHSILADPSDKIAWGRDALAVLYVAVGTALAYADRIYWAAALTRTPAELSAVENEVDEP